MWISDEWNLIAVNQKSVLYLKIDYIIFAIKWIFPTKQATWKRMQMWGNEIEINRLICKEFFDEKKPPQKSMLVWTTEHFILSPVIANRKLYYIPKYIETRFEGNKQIHCFDDGGKIVLESTQSGNDMIFSAVRRWQNNKQKNMWGQVLESCCGELDDGEISSQSPNN